MNLIERLTSENVSVLNVGLWPRQHQHFPLGSTIKSGTAHLPPDLARRLRKRREPKLVPP